MTTLIITAQQEGSHRWNDAARAEHCAPEYAYLSYVHRHLFHVRVELRVKRANRQIEFLTFKHHTLQPLLEKLFGSGAIEMSCELMAAWLYDELLEQHFPVHAVEFWEDGENGARFEAHD